MKTDILRSIIQRDVYLLRYQKIPRMFNILALIAISLLLGLSSSVVTTSVLVIGREKLQLLVLTIAGISACIEFYTRALMNDIDDEIRSTYMLLETNRSQYLFAKAVLPCSISIVNVVVLSAVYTWITSQQFFEGGVLVALCIALIFQCFLSVELTFFMSLFIKPDTKRRPDFTLYVFAASLPLVLIINPIHQLIVFIFVNAALGVICHGASLYMLRRTYRSNLT